MRNASLYTLISPVSKMFVRMGQISRMCTQSPVKFVFIRSQFLHGKWRTPGCVERSDVKGFAICPLWHRCCLQSCCGEVWWHTRHYLIHTHLLWCLPCMCLCVCVRARVLLMSERTSCHSDNKITTGMWHHMSVTCQTHVSDGSQAAAVSLPSDMLEGRDTQTDGELVHKKRHTVSR